ncbi:F-box/LRR-repeat protein [Quillaja saponaria]|uniref:F-box/LRR-repeat protein n=1 Tax=Quillaja saponaria TaxID=32244 RepID=A0AAD7L060_QUISA|nr:F-box/LRR-repeat protein [Quillaja saponaria]
MDRSALTQNCTSEKLSKRKEVVDGEDRISNLPESILSHMLSFLPTKDAVRTSVLSTKWIDIWTSITNLEFDDTLFLDDTLFDSLRRSTRSRKKYFMNFVDRVLFHFSNSSIKSFSLFMGPRTKYDPARVSAWISFVLRHRVQKLDIHYFEDVHISSRSLVSCSCLTELKLWMQCRIRVPTSLCLSNLKILKLFETKFVNDSFPHSKEIFLNFPVLKVFKCIDCIWLNAQSVCIITPLVESFTIQFPEFTLMHNESSNCSVKICSSNLERFSYSGHLSEQILLPNLSSVLDASISINEPTEDGEDEADQVGFRACMLLAQLCGMESLKLRDAMMEVLDDGSKFLARVPTFDKLILLELDSDITNIETLLDFLHKTPFLQSLAYSQRIFDFGKELLTATVVPSCLLYHLKVVRLVVSVGWEHEIYLAEFFLENSKVLEQMTIGKRFEHTDLVKLERHLTTVPKGSSSATVEFLDYNDEDDSDEESD